MSAAGRSLVTAERLVAVVCLAQVFVQIGASFWPALLPGMVELWGLSWSQAGWITAIFFGAYMIAVPVLVTATDRFDPRQVYLLGVGLTVIGHLLFGLFAEGFWSALGARALTGIGWAGTYMTGLKLLADQVDAKLMSRATAGHAASISIWGALSFACADLLSGLLGWRGAFVAAACSAAILRGCLSSWSCRDAPKTIRSRQAKSRCSIFARCSATGRPWPMRSATASTRSSITPCGAGVLRFSDLLRRARAGAGGTVLSPAIILTTLGILATFATVPGNEAAIFFGRRRFIVATMVVSAVCAGMLGLFGTHSYADRCCSRSRLRPSHFSGQFVAHGGHRRQRGAVAPRRNARGSFDARLCRRICRPADRRLGAGLFRRHVAPGLGSAYLLVAAAALGRNDRVPGYAAARPRGGPEAKQPDRTGEMKRPISISVILEIRLTASPRPVRA